MANLCDLGIVSVRFLHFILLNQSEKIALTDLVQVLSPRVIKLIFILIT